MSVTLSGRRPSESELTLVHLMSPSDASHIRRVHGGVLMRLADEAGGLAACRHARGICVTVVMDLMTFEQPVFVGDLVTVVGCVTWTGRSSVEVRVRITAEDVVIGERRHVSEAYFVYAHVHANGRTASVPPLICESDAERRAYAAAEQRRAYRLQQRSLSEH